MSEVTLYRFLMSEVPLYRFLMSEVPLYRFLMSVVPLYRFLMSVVPLYRVCALHPPPVRPVTFPGNLPLQCSNHYRGTSLLQGYLAKHHRGASVTFP